MKRKLILLLLTAALMLTGCAGKAQNKEAAELCEAFFTAFTECESAAVGRMLEGSGSPFGFNDLTAAMAKRTETEIKKVSVKGEISAVSVKIRTVDFEAILDKVSEETDSEQSAHDYLLKAIQAENAKMKAFNTDIYVKNGKIQMTSDLADALTGGYMSVLNGILEEAHK